MIMFDCCIHVYCILLILLELYPKMGTSFFRNTLVKVTQLFAPMIAHTSLIS